MAEDKLEQATPAQHHESGAASRDRAYHIARQSGMDRDRARAVSSEAVERAYRARDNAERDGGRRRGR